MRDFRGWPRIFRGDSRSRTYRVSFRYYWRIAVAKPVSWCAVETRAKLFPSLNQRTGAPLMRARRLPVLWALAFYWFNLPPAKSRCLRTSTGYATPPDFFGFFSSPHCRPFTNASRMSWFRSAKPFCFLLSTCWISYPLWSLLCRACVSCGDAFAFFAGIHTGFYQF